MKGLIHAFEDMSSPSNYIAYAKLIEMNIETDDTLAPIPSEPYTLPLKNQQWVRKGLEILEKTGLF